MATVKNFINGKDETIQFKIEYVGEMSNPYFDADASRHNKVTMRNLKTRKSATINYWGSIMEPDQDSIRGLKGALECIMLDVSAYDNARDFYDFCNEFGYDTDSRKAEKIYKGCGKEFEQFNRVVGDDSVMANIQNWIEE